MTDNNSNIFIKKAQLVHGNKYDYSKTIYINSNTKVIITCYQHGEFKQLPSAHLQAKGCSLCGKERRLEKVTITFEDYINRANEVHNNKYKYTKIVNFEDRKYLFIVCPNHGEFKQRVDRHLGGHGCRLCYNDSINKILSNGIDKFITKAKEIHGNRYDYSKSVYINNRTKLIITCPTHGDFEQSPDSHVNGKNKCPKCANKEKADLTRLTLNDFIKKSNIVHYFKYNYNKVNYVNSLTKIIIICPEHGEFEQTPNSHLSGNGCRYCGHHSTFSFTKLTMKQFIEKANIVHNTNYSYDKVIYVNNKTKLIITCPTHGDFEQTPRNHLSGQGCPICKFSKGELTIKNIFDKYEIKYQHQYKIPQIVSKLRYDFYLPDYNLLIEFHGKQHYEYIPFFHRNGEDDLLAQKNRDDIIRYNAKHHKYQYLEFSYLQLKNSTEEQFETLIISRINKYKKKIIKFSNT